MISLSVRDAERSWAVCVDEAPELAARVRARFGAHLHHVLGTVRADGAPRLSGTEVHFSDAGVSLGMMAGSRKLADVRRDPRVELHSAPLEEDLAEGDARLSGRLVETDRVEAAHPGASFFVLLVESAALVRVQADQLVVTTWRVSQGLNERRRD